MREDDVMQLDLTDEEMRALLNLLVETIEADPAGAGRNFFECVSKLTLVQQPRLLTILEGDA